MYDDESTVPLLGPSSNTPGRDSFNSSIPMGELSDPSAATSERVGNSLISLPDGKFYHVFICHSNEDTQTAIEVKDYLEGSGLKCCWHKRDFTLGQSVLDNIEEGMRNSVLVVPIISRGFLESGYCKHELNLFLHENIKKNLNNVIPVVLCPPETTPIEIQMLTYIEADEGNYLERLFERTLHILGVNHPNNSTNVLTPLLGQGRNTSHQADTDVGYKSGGFLGRIYRNLLYLERCVPGFIFNGIKRLYATGHVHAAIVCNICLQTSCGLGIIAMCCLLALLLLACFGWMYFCVDDTVMHPTKIYSVDKTAWISTCDAKGFHYKNETELLWPFLCPNMFNQISVKYCANSSVFHNFYTSYRCGKFEEHYIFSIHVGGGMACYLDDSSYAYIKQMQIVVICMWLFLTIMPVLIVLYCSSRYIKSKTDSHILKFQQNKEKTIAELALKDVHLIQGCIGKIRSFNPHDNWGDQIWHSLVEKTLFSKFYRCCLCRCEVTTLNETISKLKETREPKDDLIIWFLPKYLSRYHKTKPPEHLQTMSNEWGQLAHVKNLPPPDRSLHLPDVMCFCQFVKMNLENINKKKPCQEIILWSGDEV